MTVQASNFIREFGYSFYSVIGVQDESLPELTTDFELEEIYAEDFDYNDGEEGTNGEIYYYFKGELIFTHIIYGGDNEDFKFTELGKTMFKEMLFNYINLLLNK